jgi:hypothetical protein
MQAPQPSKGRVLRDPWTSTWPRCVGVGISFDDETIAHSGDCSEHAANAALLEKLELVATRQDLPDSITVILS